MKRIILVFVLLLALPVAFAAVDHFEFDTISSPQATDSTFPVTIRAITGAGETDTSFSDPVNLLSGSPAVSLPAEVQLVNGVATFSATTGSVPDTDVTITASGSGAVGTSNAFDVAEGADFTIEAVPQAVAVVEDRSADITLVLRPLNGFNETVTLTGGYVGQQNDVTASFSNASIQLDSDTNVTLTFTAGSQAVVNFILLPPHTFEINATSPTKNHSVDILLSVEELEGGELSSPIVDALNASINLLSLLVADLDSKLTALTTRHEAFENETVENLSSLVAGQNTLNDSVTDGFVIIDNRFNALNASTMTRLDALSSGLLAINESRSDDLEAIETALSDMRSDLTSASASLEGLNASIALLETRMLSLETENEDLRRMIAILNMTLEEREASIDEELSALDAAIGNLSLDTDEQLVSIRTAMDDLNATDHAIVCDLIPSGLLKGSEYEAQCA